MGRPSIQVQNLHGHTIEELIDLKNTTKSHYTRLALTAITMRYLEYTNEQINKVTGLSQVSIVAHVKKWNKLGLKSIEDHRGGNKESKLTPDIIDDLINVVLHKTPENFEFIGHTWTLELLSLYIKQNYGIDISGVSIRTILKSNKISHKRAQPKPTKADKAEQEAFKKNFRDTGFFRVFI